MVLTETHRLDYVTKQPGGNLGTFYKANPEFVWGPMLLTAVIQGVVRHPKVAEFLASEGRIPYGLYDSTTYTVFAILLAYAAHGWYTTHVSQKLQIQSYDKQSVKKPWDKDTSYSEREPPEAGAIRTTAALLTSFVYASIPFAPATTTWPMFIAWTMGLAVYWDLHFFIAHKTVHENPWLYKKVHKLHHSHKQPGVFSAYYVTYQSHILTEQSVILLAAAVGLPRDVFTWTIWWGTLGTYVEHCGHDVHDIMLSPLPFTFGQLSTLLSPWSLILGGESTAHHDWHHEKFLANYALSFTYLDKLLGSYHPGRVPGEAVGLDEKSLAKKAEEAAAALEPKPVVEGTPIVEETPTTAVSQEETVVPSKEEAATVAEDSRGSKMPTATYTELRLSTTADWVAQGAAFDKYAEDGNIVRNVLELVEKMKGERGEIGAMVDMYEHSLQTATRARRGGADNETIVCALLHDIGEVLSATNHGEIAAALLRPYVTPMNHWLLSQHEVFQAFFFLDKCGGDKDLRDKVKEYQAQGIVKGHPWYEACAKFCFEYDQPSFDPLYNTDTLESFVPLVAEVFDKTPFWWEPKDKKEEELDPKARLAFGYSLSVRDVKA